MTYEYVTLNKVPLLSRTNHSSMFINFNIKIKLTNKWKMFFFMTSKTIHDLDHMNMINSNDYPLSINNQCTKFGNQ